MRIEGVERKLGFIELNEYKVSGLWILLVFEADLKWGWSMNDWLGFCGIGRLNLKYGGEVMDMVVDWLLTEWGWLKSVIIIIMVMAVEGSGWCIVWSFEIDDVFFKPPQRVTNRLQSTNDKND